MANARFTAARTRLKTLVLGPLAALAACGGAEAPSTPSVVGADAEAVAEGAWENVVALTRYGRVACTGTLVAPDLVLTAAHCVPAGTTPASLKVYRGNGKDGGRFDGQYAVSRIGSHPDYPGTVYGWSDLAYVRLAEPMQGVEPARIATEFEELRTLLAPGKRATLVGFGIHDNRTRALGAKWQGTAPVRFRGAEEVYIGDSTGDGCDGDSGGPAFGQLADGSWRVFGVTSRGPTPCGSDAYPGVWGLMAAHVCWVERETGVRLAPEGTCAEAAPGEYAATSETDLATLCERRSDDQTARHTIDVLRALYAETQGGTLRADDVSCGDMAAWATSQRHLDLSNAMLRDVSPLAHLTALESLSLEDNRLTDVSALARLPKLTVLHAGWNDLTRESLEPLVAKGVRVRGASLQKRSWRADHATPFLQACVAAERGELDAAMKRTLDAIKRAACLGATCNCYTANEDVQLARELYLAGAELASLEPLHGLVNLQRLVLARTPALDLTPVASLENLRVLDLSDAPAPDLSPLAHLIRDNRMHVRGM